MTVGAFDDYFARMMPQAEAWFAGQVRGDSPEPPSGGFMIPPELRSEILATKLSATLLVSDELLNPRPSRPLTRRERLRYKVSDWREQIAYRAFKIITGYDVPEPEDW
jgi:hypothetical protein